MMRSAPPLEEPDSDSLPIPDSLPNPPNDGMLGGSAGLATGRPPNELDGVGATGAVGAAARTTGLGAAFGAAAFGAAVTGLRPVVEVMFGDFMGGRRGGRARTGADIHRA